MIVLTAAFEAKSGKEKELNIAPPTPKASAGEGMTYKDLIYLMYFCILAKVNIVR